MLFPRCFPSLSSQGREILHTFLSVSTGKAWICLEELWGEACPQHLHFLNNTCSLIGGFPEASRLVTPRRCLLPLQSLLEVPATNNPCAYTLEVVSQVFWLTLLNSLHLEQCDWLGVHKETIRSLSHVYSKFWSLHAPGQIFSRRYHHPTCS